MADRVPATESRALKEIEKLMVACAKNRASDLHLKVGLKPILRINTQLHEVGNVVLTAERIRAMVYEILTPEQRQTFETRRDLDFAYSISGIGRFRINLFYDRGAVAIAARRVNTYIPTFEELHLPASLRRLCDFDAGLVMVAGPTGSGKSTTLACILEEINKTQKLHVVTIEDPIEYLFEDRLSFVNQREIGIDVSDWHSALRTVVRQDPDVILVGEMRDHVSMESALLASETGHLVFSTIHASSAASTIGRMLELFPVERQPLIRQSMAFNLKAIICQKLLPASKEGVRVVPAVEILFMNPSAQKLVMHGEDKKLQELIRASREEDMQDFNQAIHDLLQKGYVTKKTALEYSPNPEQLKMLMQGIVLTDDRKILG